MKTPNKLYVLFERGMLCGTFTKRKYAEEMKIGRKHGDPTRKLKVEVYERKQ